MLSSRNEVFSGKSELLDSTKVSLCGTQKQSPPNCALHHISGVFEQVATSCNKS